MACFELYKFQWIDWKFLLSAVVFKEKFKKTTMPVASFQCSIVCSGINLEEIIFLKVIAVGKLFRTLLRYL